MKNEQKEENYKKRQNTTKNCAIYTIKIIWKQKKQWTMTSYKVIIDVMCPKAASEKKMKEKKC